MLLQEIRIHGRGGQGAVTAAELLAHAVFSEGKWAQAFAFFGAERRGAPVEAFVRIADKPNPIRSRVYTPDYVIVFDFNLFRVVNVTEGLKKDGIIIINTDKTTENLDLNNYRVATVDATRISLKLNLLVAGLPVLNSTMLGAFAKASEEVNLATVVEAIKKRWPGTVGEKNALAAAEAYKNLFVGW